LTGERRFSEAISEGDGISVIVEVAAAADARAAEADGAEALVVRGQVDGLAEASSLPVLWIAEGAPAAAIDAGADAWLLSLDRHDDEVEELERLYAEATELGLDCVVVVRDEDQLDAVLERLDPEIILLSARPGDDEDPLERALDLLPDVPAGKLAIADAPVSGRESVVALERAGVDAVIVGAVNVAELVGGAPPEV
jgi:indole-3-glycerol phosphate synthase